MVFQFSQFQCKTIARALDAREEHALERLLDERYEEVRQALPQNHRGLLFEYGQLLKDNPDALPPDALYEAFERPEEAIAITRAYFLYERYREELTTAYLGSSYSVFHHTGYGDEIENFAERFGVNDPREYAQRNWREAVEDAPPVDVDPDLAKKGMQDAFVSLIGIVHPPICHTEAEAEEAVRDMCEGLAQIASEHIVSKGREI